MGKVTYNNIEERNEHKTRLIILELYNTLVDNKINHRCYKTQLKMKQSIHTACF